MADLRENLGWLLGVIIAGVTAFLGWFYESGLLNTLIGIIIGAGIAYFVQTQTQKRTWKREYAIKIAEEVYGTLFRITKNIIESLENKYYHWLSVDEWNKIQDSYRYFMVDEKFRAKLDDFFARTQKYGYIISKVRNEVLPKIVREEGERIFKTDTQEIKLEVKYKYARAIVSASPEFIECLISQIHPKDYILRRNPEITDILEFHVLFGQVPAGRDVEDKFDKFWESCLKRMEEDKTRQHMLEETNGLLEEARKIKKELEKRIEEPWKI